LEDVIYGRKFGTALTMDVFTPNEHAKGIGVVVACSGGWFSDHAQIATGFAPYWTALLKRGYTVFAVVHGSNPKYTIPEILLDMHRAVRFIRYNAKAYGIDPNRIGITGGSAGGHLSLMQGTAGADGDPKSPDPIDRVSSRVQAVACFFPPTDFLNYGATGKVAIGGAILKEVAAPFEFQEWDNDRKVLKTITDKTTIHFIVLAISPINHVSANTPPTLIFHGDADPIVPLQQSQIFIEKLKQNKVPCELVVKHGAGHGWGNGLDADFSKVCDWFDKYLR
jgi:acetyl esterase/lipase